MHSALSSTAVHKYKPIQLFESQRLVFNLLQDPENYREAVERCKSSSSARRCGAAGAKRRDWGLIDKVRNADFARRCSDTASVVLAVSYGRRVDGPHNPIVLGVTDLMSEPCLTCLVSPS